jgi:hypothetical protein
MKKNQKEFMIKAKKETLVENIQEGLEKALNEHGLEIKIKNLEEIVNIIASLLVDLQYNKSIQSIVMYIRVQLEISVPIQNTYIISYTLEGQEDIVEYHLDDYRIPSKESILIVQILSSENYGNEDDDLPKKKKKTKTELLKEVLNRHGIEFEHGSDYNPYSTYNHYDEFYFILPLEVEVKKFWI